MTLTDKIQWLEQHGAFTTKIWRCTHNRANVGWRTNGGYPILAEGETTSSMMHALYDEVESSLWAECVYGGDDARHT